MKLKTLMGTKIFLTVRIFFSTTENTAYNERDVLGVASYAYPTPEVRPPARFLQNLSNLPSSHHHSILLQSQDYELL